MTCPRKTLSWAFLLLTIGCFGATAATNAVSSPAAPAIAPISFSIFRVIGALALVLALFVGGALVFRQWQTVSLRKNGPALLAVLEARPLGNRQTLYVVGYEKQRMLIASSAAGVTLVSTLPASEIAASAQSAPTATFGDALRSVLSRS